MTKILNKKPRIAIFDLTDCEGCELEFINLREKLTDVICQVDVANWRMASDNHDLGPFDITFIEGSPMTETDIETVKQARAVSNIVISLGSCAELGGIQGMFAEKDWKENLPKTFDKDYKTKSKAPKPLSYYIDVDLHISGCPISTSELEKFLGALLIGKKPELVSFPVCLECKARENNCLLLEGQPCLGPVTKGGCEAACPTRGLRCWGCYGALEGGNTKALANLFIEKYGEKRTKQLLGSFFSHQNQFKEVFPTKFVEKDNIKTPKKIKVKVS